MFVHVCVFVYLFICISNQKNPKNSKMLKIIPNPLILFCFWLYLASCTFENNNYYIE